MDERSGDRRTGGRRTEVQVHGDQLAGAIAATLGRDLRTTRKRRRWPRGRVAAAVGLGRSRYAVIERGEGANSPLSVWVKLGTALGRPLAIGLSRELDLFEAGPRDAGHLAAQELAMRLARGHGRRSTAELATRPAEPAYHADVVLQDDRQRVLLLVEIVNRSGDLGAAIRSTQRKQAELERLAVVSGGDGGPYGVAAGWLLVDTAANRRLVTRYPEFLRARFPGSAVAWARALYDGAPPPREPALAWVDGRSDRIYALRWLRA